jgi:hypothetical protein
LMSRPYTPIRERGSHSAKATNAPVEGGVILAHLAVADERA